MRKQKSYLKKKDVETKSKITKQGNRTLRTERVYLGLKDYKLGATSRLGSGRVRYQNRNVKRKTPTKSLDSYEEQKGHCAKKINRTVRNAKKTSRNRNFWRRRETLQKHKKKKGCLMETRPYCHRGRMKGRKLVSTQGEPTEKNGATQTNGREGGSKRNKQEKMLKRVGRSSSYPKKKKGKMHHDKKVAWIRKEHLQRKKRKRGKGQETEGKKYNSISVRYQKKKNK